MRIMMNNPIYIFASLFLFITGCTPDDLPIVPTKRPDCSYDHTVPTENADTILNFQCVGSVQDSFTTGISVLDLALNPTNPNQICIAISRDLYSFDGIFPIDEIWVYDQCKGTAVMLGSDVDFPTFPYGSNIFWGFNNRIIYETHSGWRSVLPDGSEAVEYSYSTFSTPNIPKFTINGNLLLSKYFNNQSWIIEYDTTGMPIDTTESQIGYIHDILPDGRVLGIGTSNNLITIFDLGTGQSTVVDQSPIYSLTAMAYSDSLESVIWIGNEDPNGSGFQSSLGSTSLVTGARTVLWSSGPNRLYFLLDVSKNKICALRVDKGFIQNCLARLWHYPILINPDGTDERRLVLPF